MAISVMLSKLGEGMAVSLLIFVVTLVFSLPLGMLVAFGRMAKNPLVRGIFQGIYIDYAGNSADASVDDDLFWTVLPVRNSEYADLEEYGGSGRFCIELCSVFCRDLPWWN